MVYRKRQPRECGLKCSILDFFTNLCATTRLDNKRSISETIGSLVPKFLKKARSQDLSKIFYWHSLKSKSKSKILARSSQSLFSLYILEIPKSSKIKIEGLIWTSKETPNNKLESPCQNFKLGFFESFKI